jgi:hypothetical protein
MKIILELDHSIDAYTAEEMVETFKTEPWITNAFVEAGGCGSCKKCEESKIEKETESL